MFNIRNSWVIANFISCTSVFSFLGQLVELIVSAVKSCLRVCVCVCVCVNQGDPNHHNCYTLRPVILHGNPDTHSRQLFCLNISSWKSLLTGKILPEPPKEFTRQFPREKYPTQPAGRHNSWAYVMLRCALTA